MRLTLPSVRHSNSAYLCLGAQEAMNPLRCCEGCACHVLLSECVCRSMVRQWPGTRPRSKTRAYLTKTPTSKTPGPARDAGPVIIPPYDAPFPIYDASLPPKR